MIVELRVKIQEENKLPEKETFANNFSEETRPNPNFSIYLAKIGGEEYAIHGNCYALERYNKPLCNGKKSCVDCPFFNVIRIIKDDPNSYKEEDI